MAKIVKAQVGLEDFFELAKSKKRSIWSRTWKCKSEAVAKWRTWVSEKKSVIDKIFADVSFEEEVADEVVDEIQEQVVAENLGRIIKMQEIKNKKVFQENNYK